MGSDQLWVWSVVVQVSCGSWSVVGGGQLWLVVSYGWSVVGMGYGVDTWLSTIVIISAAIVYCCKL